MNIPNNLKYTKDHEWIRVEAEFAFIGITDFAQNELGDIVYVDIDSLDEDIEKDEIFGTVEAVKTVSDLIMPVTGKILEINQVLEDAPEKINSDPYGEGWMIKIKLNNPNQLDDFLDSETYKKLIGA